MKVTKHIISTGEKIRIQYPGDINKPIIGLDKDIEYYGIIENERPSYDENLYQLERVETYKADVFEDKKHLKTHEIIYNIIELPTSQIINSLNKSLGNYLDTQYPAWQETKHLGNLFRLQNIGPENWKENELARFNYIVSVGDWQKECRELRDQKEIDLLEKNILPNFEWLTKPIKPENAKL